MSWRCKKVSCAKLVSSASRTPAISQTVFSPDYVIYKNELAVRSKVFRFHLLDRTYPSLPPNGF